MRKKNSPQRGNIMAWFAAFLAFVAVPLAALTIDVVRAFYVYTHLQAATDAACEAAAQALDVSTFIRTGARQIDLGLGASYAGREFAGAVVDQGVVAYSPSLSGLRLLSPTVAECRATASLTLFVPAASPALTVRVASVAEMRVNRR
ncbi:putative Flp pilus-assembly TadE/G-like [Anaerolinea thermolimosa]|uniref:pilus assembly protein TadG-related protein n=1 Tax=Anaerolinea thermolimosa TaxID=229919 RepID=UPI000781303C|nr:pilus assembly protein TadG-related protein [Anaerolinea thermolimosa]GAP06144.1 putative Flp pilus-assembly TadE/G-like [Anaerolinea thermolimosa]